MSPPGQPAAWITKIGTETGKTCMFASSATRWVGPRWPRRPPMIILCFRLTPRKSKGFAARLINGRGWPLGACFSPVTSRITANQPALTRSALLTMYDFGTYYGTGCYSKCWKAQIRCLALGWHWSRLPFPISVPFIGYFA